LARDEQESAACLDDILKCLGVLTSSYVYFIEAIGRNEIKIGTSSEPEKRLLELQTGNGSQLELLGMMGGNRTVECEIHDRFQQYRVRQAGEWFYGADEVREFIARNTESQLQVSSI
ncbi:MAG: GIY-YIG nuclease family protein, partial [Pirellulales bacterium]